MARRKHSVLRWYFWPIFVQAIPSHGGTVKIRKKLTCWHWIKKTMIGIKTWSWWHPFSSCSGQHPNMFNLNPQIYTEVRLRFGGPLDCKNTFEMFWNTVDGFRLRWKATIGCVGDVYPFWMWQFHGSFFEGAPDTPGGVFFQRMRVWSPKRERGRKRQETKIQTTRSSRMGILPGKLTCPLKINGWKMYFLLK